MLYKSGVHASRAKGLTLGDLLCALERRGHRFVRYADDLNIYVKSRREGRLVLRSVGGKSIKRFKAKVREATFRTRGVCIGRIIEELRRYLLGWQAYFNFTEAGSILKELDSWIKRRLRCYLWKQWGRNGYRKLVSVGSAGILRGA